jgi:hypothetical protein
MIKKVDFTENSLRVNELRDERNVQGVTTVKRYGFVVQDVYSETHCFFFWKLFKSKHVLRVLNVSYVLQEFKLPPKFLDYLTGHLTD